MPSTGNNSIMFWKLQCYEYKLVKKEGAVVYDLMIVGVGAIFKYKYVGLVRVYATANFHVKHFTRVT